MSEHQIRIFLTDDHPIYRDGLRLQLETDPELIVVGEASSGEETLERLGTSKPDLLLLDINLPDMSGGAVASKVRKSEAGRNCAMMFVTMEKSAVVLQHAVDLDVGGYLLKNSGAAEMIKAVKAVVAGEKYFSPAVADLLLTRARSSSDRFEGVDALTFRERQILKLIANDLTSKEIAADLGVSVRTVEGHRASMAKKLRLSGVHSLVKFAFAHRDRL